MRIDLSYRTIAELRAFTAQDVRMNSKVYTVDSGKEGEWIYDSSDTTSADNLGTILVTASGARYKRSFDKKVFVRWFKELSGGTDTTAINAAITYAVDNSLICVFETGTYNVVGNLYNNASVSGDKDLYLEFVGKVKIALNSASQVDLALIIYGHNANSNVHIFGDSLEVDLNNECKGFIAVKNYGISGSTYVTDGGSCVINLSNLTILNTYADDTTDNSAAALWVDGTYERVLIENVFVNGVTRENAATGDCKGIVVTNTRANVVVRNCTVKNILTTGSFDANADGISVFGLKINGAIENCFRTGKALVDNCHFVDCQGRGVKIQTSKATVSNSLFEHNLVITMPNSRDIDFQYGNGRAVGNTIIFKKNGSTSPLNEYHASIRWCAILEDEEMYGIAENNTFYTDVVIPYPFFIEHRDWLSVAVERSTYDVINNHIINTDAFVSTGCIGKSFLEFDALHIEQLETQSTINVRDNSYFSSAQPLLGYNSSTGISLGDKLIFTLENNKNTNLSVLPKLFSYSIGTEALKVNRYKIFNNAGFNDRVSSVWIVDFNNEKIIPHSEFVVDLSTNTVANSRLLNAPSGIPTTDYAFVKVLNEWEGVTYIQIYVHGTTRQYFYEWNGFDWKSHSIGVDSSIGQHQLTLTTSGTTNVTLPTTGTLVTLAGTESLTNKTVNGVVLSTGAGSTNFLNGAGGYSAPIGGGGDALTSNPLSQFSATTSAQLSGVISDETGSGALVFATSPTLVTPALGTPSSGNLANCTFPTLNQSTTGSAATLTTPRTIGGVNFDGSAAIVPQTIQSVNEAADTTCFPLFISASGTQSLQPLNNTAFTFNASTGALGVTTLVTGGSGITIGSSVPFSDSAGTLTLQNVDVLDATTEATIEAAIDTLANLTSIQGQTVTLTGAFIRSGAHSLTLTTTGTTTVTLPTTGTLATTDGTETFLNKTLTAAKIANAGRIDDPNGNEYITFVQIGSAVNQWTVTNAATGGTPSWSVTGGDTNINANIVSKGTGVVQANGVQVVTTTGTLTLTNKTLTDAVNTVSAPTTLSVGYLGIPQNSQSTAYTLVMADSGKHILHPSADTAARTFTIPANSSVAFPIGTSITFVNQNAAGVITIAITTDTMRLAGAGTTGSRTLAANGVATAIKITSTEWIISGNGLT